MTSPREELLLAAKEAYASMAGNNSPFDAEVWSKAVIGLEWAIAKAEADTSEPPQSIANRYYAMGVNHTGPKVPMPCAPPYRNLNEEGK